MNADVIHSDGMITKNCTLLTEVDVKASLPAGVTDFKHLFINLYEKYFI